MKKLLLIFSSLLCSAALWAQVYTSPTFVTSETNETFYVYYDPAQSNPEMANVAECYAHTGVIISKSSSDSDWKHAPEWGDNSDKYKMTKEGDLWKLEITGGLKAYYGLTDDEVVTKLAFVFRDAKGEVQGKTSGGTDILYTLYEAGVPAITLISPANGGLQKINSTIAIKGEASMKGKLEIKVNGETYITKEDANIINEELTLENTGSYTIEFTLSKEGKVLASDKASFYVPTPVVEKQVPEQYLEGINYHTDCDSITLVLRAPLNEDVYIIGDFNNWTYNENFQMYRADVKCKFKKDTLVINDTINVKDTIKVLEGDIIIKDTIKVLQDTIIEAKDSTRLFWRTIAVKDPTKKYGFQYYVDGTKKISDPYSEVVIDPWNDKYITKLIDTTLPAHPGEAKADGLVSVLEGPKAKEVYNWQVEEFDAPDAKDLVIYELLIRDFDNSKSLEGVIKRLDYLKDLGINAIELMPVTEFDGNDSWGYNPNHFFAYDKAYGDRNTYKKFIDECHKRGIAVIIDMVFNHATGICPMAKLYWDGDATASNNPWFNRVARHPFNVFHDINHEYEGTRNYFKRVLQYWVEEYKVDGYRMDLTKGFTQKNTGNDAGKWSQYDASRIVILKDYCDAAKSINPNTYFIIEHLGDNREEVEYAKYGILPWRNMNHNYCQAAMGVASSSNFADGNDLKKVTSNYPNSLGGMFTDGWVGYAESHDEERTMFKAVAYGDARLKAADAHAARMYRVPAVMAFTTLIPGPKMIWQFQELGYDYSINYCNDRKNSDECRTYAKPIPWTKKFDQDPDRWAAYETCGKVISLRTEHPEIFRAENFTSVNLTGASFDKPRRMDISYKDPENSNNNIDIIILGNFHANTNISTLASVPNLGVWYNYLTKEPVYIRRADHILTLKPGELLILTSKPVEDLVSIGEAEADENSCIVLPTIAEDYITVIGKETPSSVEVINLSGNVVAKAIDTDNISIDGLAKGHYIVRVNIDNNISTHRIIKK